MKSSLIMFSSLLVSALLLGGCGAAGDPRERSMARCERSFARMSPDPAAGKAMCSCLIDQLEAEGMSIIDTMGNDRGKEIARQCAAQAGVPLPNGG